MIAGDAAFDLLSTYGIPVEVTESLAADQNLRVDMPGVEAARVKFAAVSRGTTEAADVFATGPLDTLKEAYHHGSEFLGYTATEATAKVIGILEQGQARPGGRRSLRAGRRSRWCSIGRRSTASRAVRSATSG